VSNYASTQNFLESLQGTLQKYVEDENWEDYNSLYKVVDFLPLYPVCAVLEAEYQGLSKLVPILRQQFGVLPLR